MCENVKVVALSNEDPRSAGMWMGKVVAPIISIVAPHETEWSASSPGRFSSREN